MKTMLKIIRRKFSPLFKGETEGVSNDATPTPTNSPSGRGRDSQRGSVVLTVVLFMVILMTSAAVVLSGTLIRHVRASQDYLASERAFAGANSGIEEMLYQFRKNNLTNGNTGDVEISYGSTHVTYDGSWEEHPDDDKIPCMTSAGTYGSLVRRIKLGGDACDI